METRGTEGAFRLFVAVELPGALREALSALGRELRRRVPPGSCRWVRPESLHLTLKFLGEVSRGRLADIGPALATVAAAGRPLDLSPAALGTFGGPSRVRVVWAGLQGDVAALGALAVEVDAALGAVGFPREARPFRPHLTLGRVRDRVRPEDRRRIAAAVDALPVPGDGAFTVDRIALIRSILGPGGARYQRQEVFALTGA